MIVVGVEKLSPRTVEALLSAFAEAERLIHRETMAGTTLTVTVTTPLGGVVSVTTDNEPVDQSEAQAIIKEVTRE